MVKAKKKVQKKEDSKAEPEKVKTDGVQVAESNNDQVKTGDTKAVEVKSEPEPKYVMSLGS